MDPIYPDALPVSGDWIWYKNRWAKASGVLVDGDSIPSEDFHNRSMVEVIAITTILGTNPEGTYGDIAERMDAAVYGTGTEGYIPKWTESVGDSQIYDDGATVHVASGISVSGVANIAGRVHLDYSLSVKGYSIVGGNALASGTHTVNSVSNLMGNLHADADTSIKGTLNVGADIYASGAFTTSELIVQNDIHSSGNITAEGAISASGDVSAGGVSNLLGNVHVDSDVSLKADLNVGSDALISGDLVVKGPKFFAR